MKRGLSRQKRVLYYTMKFRKTPTVGIKEIYVGIQYSRGWLASSCHFFHFSLAFTVLFPVPPFPGGNGGDDGWEPLPSAIGWLGGLVWTFGLGEFRSRWQNLSVGATGGIFMLPRNKLMHILCTSPGGKAAAWGDAPLSSASSMATQQTFLRVTRQISGALATAGGVNRGGHTTKYSGT